MVPQCLGCVYVSCGGTSTGSSWDQIPFFPGTVALLLKGKLCVREEEAKETEQVKERERLIQQASATGAALLQHC